LSCELTIYSTPFNLMLTTMIEKSPEVKIYEQADAMMQSFRASVRQAQQSAREAGVPVSLFINGHRYNAMPDGEIVSVDNESGG